MTEDLCIVGWFEQRSGGREQVGRVRKSVLCYLSCTASDPVDPAQTHVGQAFLPAWAPAGKNACPTRRVPCPRLCVGMNSSSASAACPRKAVGMAPGHRLAAERRSLLAVG